MTFAEKYYRGFYKVKPDAKLTNEQWKFVNMMHQCLQENNKPKLPHGTILVKKQALVDHLRQVKKCIVATDDLMKKPECKEFAKGSGGKELVKIINALDFTMQSTLHFQLNVPLKRAGEEITNELIK